MNTSVETSNPYQPPGVQDGDLPASTVARTTTLVIPPILAVIGTLILWIAMVMLFDLSSNARILIFVWSATLLSSLTVATFLVHRIWRTPLSAVAMCSGFVLLGIAFCSLEGDVTGGKDWLHAVVLYGTLIAAPIIVFALTKLLNQVRFPRSIPVGEQPSELQ